ncbi:DUF4083 family protein [Ferdinandcohnia sp. Marseille-Q9671]
MSEFSGVGFLLLANILVIGFVASIFWAVRIYFVKSSREPKSHKELEERIDQLEQKLDKIIELLEKK